MLASQQSSYRGGAAEGRAVELCGTLAIVISPRAREMLISDSVAASAFAGLPITR